MALFDLGKITEALTDLKEYGISFNGQQKKWESESDGTVFKISQNFQEFSKIHI